jgi:hypothetical protein
MPVNKKGNKKYRILDNLSFCLLKKSARKTIKAILAYSEGWKSNPATLIQRRAPPIVTIGGHRLTHYRQDIN